MGIINSMPLPMIRNSRNAISLTAVLGDFTCHRAAWRVGGGAAAS